MDELLRTDPECVLLHELRATPQLLQTIADWSGSEMSLQKQLRGHYSAELVRAALSLVDQRRRASGKFTRAAEMWFDAKSLEQATAEVVAQHKAQRFHGDVWDFCCGIGADTVALALAKSQVTAIDLIPSNALRTQWNAEVHGVGDRVLVRAADIHSITERPGLLHIDPDRRPGPGRRVIRIEECQPGLDTLQQLARDFKGGAIKLSPASNFGGKFDGCEIELISLYGECKEATIWFGELAGNSYYRATALPSGESLAADPLSAWTNVGELGAYVFDPDPAIVRAGLVDVLAERLGLRRLDDAEEYLTGDTLVTSPFVQAFQVLDSVPNNERDIRNAVRQQSFGQVEIKCRHIPINVEAVRRKLPLEGTEPGVVIFTRQAGRSKAVICRRESWKR